MASKTLQTEPEKAGVIEELLDTLDLALDRVKVLYEQYFLGIQKQAPTHLHTDVERKLRDLSQMQIRNTALRYRFVTIQQKFGSYNSYWRRTLRKIESGTYGRALSKLGRQAAQSGAEIPAEILAAMPKRMQAQILRDREAALATAARRAKPSTEDDDFLEPEPDTDEASPELLAAVRLPRGPQVLDDSADDLDFDAFFASMTDEPPANAAPPAPPPAPATPAPLRAASLGGGARPATPARETQLFTSPGKPAVRPSVPGAPSAPAPIAMAGPTETSVAAARPATPPVPAAAPAAAPAAPALTPPAAPRPSAQMIPSVLRSSGELTAASGPLLPVTRPTGNIPPIPRPGQTPPGPTSIVPTGPPESPRPRRSTTLAPSQVTRPNPIVAGMSRSIPAQPVETLAGPFPREPRAHPDTDLDLPQPGALPSPVRPQSQVPPRTQPLPRAVAPRPQPVAPRPAAPQPAAPRPAAPPAARTPPGMSEADVNTLYAKYVKAKEMVGETAGPGAYGKLLNTINAQAPKIMAQYKAKGVDFTVVVKDNQVIIRAKPKG